MRILVVMSYAPLPVKSGVDRLVANLIEGLAERHRVYLATMYRDRDEGDRLRRCEREGVSIRGMIAPNRRSDLHRLLYKIIYAARSAARRIPMQVLYATPPSFLGLVERIVRDERIDLVIPVYWHFADLAERLAGTAVALATMDIDYRIDPERLRADRSPLKRLFAERSRRVSEQFERAAYRRYGAILTVTESDAACLRAEEEFAGKTIVTLPLAIDLDRYDPSRFERDGTRLLMIGVYEAGFNRDALRYLLDEVFPLVRERSPDIVLEIIGPGAAAELRRRGRRNVRYHGMVDDIRPHLGTCGVMVLPLRFGGGVRIRMMEAAAMATPVVSTPCGVAGMGLAAGVDYLEASTPVEMAASIVRLVDDRAAAGEIGRNARRWVERHYAMGDYPDRLDAFLERLASRSSKSPM